MKERRMEIAIALDTYDDLFSDFDIRGYGVRALSKDFLDELRIRLRRAWTKPDLNVVLLLPAGVRNAADEGLIVERIRAFYADRREHYLREDKKAKLNSLLFVAIGLALSVAANVIVERIAALPLFNDFLLIPSWFFVWSGFELFNKSREEIGRKKKYYAALSDSRTTFRDIEGYQGRIADGKAPGARA
jgi:hypothetical protein